MKRKYITGIVAALLVSLIVYKLATNKKVLDEKNKGTQITSIRIPVKVASVTSRLVEINIIKTGQLAPFKEAGVLTTSAGILKQLPFQLGDQVQQNQVLAIMDNQALQLDLQKSEANVAKLKTDLATYAELLGGKAATQERVNGIKQDYENAFNQSQQIRKQIEDASIKAPISGIISSKNMEQGEFAPAGTEVATIVNLSKAKVLVNLTETEIYSVNLGDMVKITTDVYPGKILEGRISFISPQADPTHNYVVEIMINNTQQSMLRSGTFVDADFFKKTSQQALLIPREAIIESIQSPAVYVVVKNRVHQKEIRVGREISGMVEVLSGLQNSEQVVVSGQINLKEGTEINISK